MAKVKWLKILRQKTKSLHVQTKTRRKYWKSKCLILKKIRIIRLCKITILKITHPVGTLPQRISLGQELCRWAYRLLQLCNSILWIMELRREREEGPKGPKISITTLLDPQMENPLLIRLPKIMGTKQGALSLTRISFRMQIRWKDKRLFTN